MAALAEAAADGSGPASCCATSRTSTSRDTAAALGLQRGHRQEPDLARPRLAALHVRGLAAAASSTCSRGDLLMVNDLRALLRDSVAAPAARRRRPAAALVARRSSTRTAPPAAWCWAVPRPGHRRRSCRSRSSASAQPLPGRPGRGGRATAAGARSVRAGRRAAGGGGGRLPDADVVHATRTSSRDNGAVLRRGHRRRPGAVPRRASSADQRRPATR